MRVPLPVWWVTPKENSIGLDHGLFELRDSDIPLLGN